MSNAGEPRAPAPEGAGAVGASSDDGEALFREMANGLPLIIWVHDATGAQVMVNDTFCEFFGVTRERMKGGLWQVLMHPEDAGAYSEEFFRCLREQRPFHAEVRVKRADGEWRWIESWGRPRFTAAGAFRGMVGTSADVTERKVFDERLRDSDRRKDEYLAMLGHELRNPLAAIQNATDVIRLKSSADPAIGRAAGVLERQSAHMAGLIDGLLEVSRIARGKIDIEKVKLDVRAAIERVLEDRMGLIAARGLQLEKILPGGPVWICADEVRVTQILDNLVGNAVKFTPAPGRITVALQQENGSALIRVCDTGVGIRRESLSRIFEPFHQEDQGVARGGGGLGLGLALARALAELHEGTIEARSAGPGTGSEFLLKFPLTDAPAAEEPGPSLASPPRHRILIVEDNRDAGQMLCDLLELHGHEPSIVENGKQALDFIRSQDVGLVLCDIGLPDIDGYEIARTVRADPALRELRLVALTGYGQPEDKLRAERAGFDAHLIKPLTSEDLDEVLRRCLPHRG